MKHNWRQWLQTVFAGKTKHPGRRRQSSRPILEVLEERTLLSGGSPFVESINRTAPVGPTTSAANVTYTVTFNEPVTGVDTGDFSLAFSGSVGATVAQVTPVSGAVYTVKVSGITGTGSLGLNLVDNNSIRDLAGDGLVQPNAPASFLGCNSFGGGVYPISVAIGDVNGDGKPDLVVANYDSSGASVLLGNGDGTFQSPTALNTGAPSTSVAVADVNGDGKLDLVIGNYGHKSVSVLLGNGDGTFQSQAVFATGSSPTSVKVADVNGDGKPDLVVADLGSNGVSVLLGNGDGTFQRQVFFATGMTPRSVAVADVNNDGKPDLVVANSNSHGVSVLLGNGDGTFQGQTTFATGSFPSSVTVVDLNGDGKADLAIANDNMAGSVSVLLGNGDGTFQNQATVATGPLTNSVAEADVNGDGKPDLVVSNYGANSVSVLLGNGDGSFQSQATFAIGAGPYSVAVADVSGDGRPDVVAVNYHSGTVSVLLNGQKGDFAGQAYTIVAPVPPTHFVISGAQSNATAGTSFTFTVTAEDPFNNTATAYSGTVAFTSTDHGAFTVLPNASPLLSGVGTFSAVLTTAGNQTLTATDNNTSGVTGTLTGSSAPIVVSAATASHLVVNAPATAVSGTGFRFTVTSEDRFNNTATAYNGTVAFTSTDHGASTVLPNAGPLLSGVGSFSAVLTTAGNQTLTATDNNTSGVTGTLTSSSGPIVVSAAAASHFVVNAPAAAVAGTGFQFTVMAEDRFNNAATAYNGSVTFTSTDHGAFTVLPNASPLVAGVGTFSAVLTTAGNQTLTATDNNTSGVTGTLTGSSGPIVVSAATASHLVVNAPATAVAGAGFRFTVTAEDRFNNRVANYSGTVKFTTSDKSAGVILPANATLAGGAGAFSATLQTQGSQTLTATDAVSSTIAGTATVNVGSLMAATHFVISAPAEAVAGSGFRFTVTAETAANKTATGYTGTVTFTSTDIGAWTVVPVSGALINGVGTFSATLTTAGGQKLTATAKNASGLAGNITGTSGTIAVSAATASHLVVKVPAGVVAGTGFRFTVTALDRFNNTAAGFCGAVTFTSSDPGKEASLPAKAKLTGGMGTFSATLVTAGNQTVTASDHDEHLTGQSGPIMVSAAAASHFEIKAPATATAGTAFQFTVTAEDRFNNTVTLYSGTFHFTCSQSSAALPANATLTGGKGVFSATLNIKGSDQKLQATDTANPALSGISNKINVKGRGEH